MSPISHVSPPPGSGCRRGDSSMLAVGCSSSVPQFTLSAMGVVSLGQGCWESWWKEPFGVRWQQCGGNFGSRRRAPGPGGRDATGTPSPAGVCQAGGGGGQGGRLGCPGRVGGSRVGDPVPSPGQGEECLAAEVGHLNCRCGRPWSRTSSGRSGPRAGALAKAVAVWQHFSCPCLPPPPQTLQSKTALGLPAASPRQKAEPSGN